MTVTGTCASREFSMTSGIRMFTENEGRVYSRNSTSIDVFCAKLCPCLTCKIITRKKQRENIVSVLTNRERLQGFSGSTYYDFPHSSLSKNWKLKGGVVESQVVRVTVCRGQVVFLVQHTVRTRDGHYEVTGNWFQGRVKEKSLNDH